MQFSGRAPLTTKKMKEEKDDDVNNMTSIL